MDAKFKREIVPVPEAQERVLRQVRVLERETVRLEEAVGRRLAEVVSASHAVPHFRRSGMDGFALRAAETVGASADTPVRLAVAAVIPCGEVMGQPLLPGQAARIMTGAAVPDEADAVIMFEQTETVMEDGVAYVHVLKEVRSGANVSEVGLEVQEGERLLEAGRRVGAGESALLAMFGHPTVVVARRPRVAVFATGSELLRVEEPLQPGRIRNSNGYMLAAQVRSAGAEPVLMEAVPDEVEPAKALILRALEEYDAVVTTGGVSVGDYDILYDLTQTWDGELLFNKVAMRPGSPTTVGVRQGKLLFALSGNPGACFVGFELFVRPALRSMMGVELAAARPIELTAVMAVDYAKGDKFTKYLRGVRQLGEDGVLRVTPVGIDASSITVSIRDADCLIVIPFGDSGVRAGERVRVIPLDIEG